MRAQASLAALVEAIGSDAPSPGCGAAAGVALALAAACARKAVAITARHAPDARLADADALFARIAAAALAAGEADADHFAALIAALGHDDNAVADEKAALVGVASRLLDLVARLRTVIDAVEPAIRPQLSGDLLAARALADAGEAIERANLAEA